jgi:hypothetical protein
VAQSKFVECNREMLQIGGEVKEEIIDLGGVQANIGWW